MPSRDDSFEEKKSHRVALMGFTSFEQQALDSYLRLARVRTPSYESATDVEACDFIVANGDRSGVVDMIITSQRMGDTVLVGSHARQGAAAWLERPIDPLHLFRALDTAVRRRDLAASAARPAPRQIAHADIDNPWTMDAPTRLSPQRGMATWPAPATEQTHPLSGEPLATLEGPLGRAGGERHVTMEATRQGAGLQAVPKRVPPGPGEPLLALVVDASDDGAMDIAMALQAHGISSERAQDSRGAFAALEEQVFDLIVIDVVLGSHSDLDGLSLTQAMRRQPRPYGEACPPILVTSLAASALEHAQAMLAGATSYLAKPIGQTTLSQALEDAELRSATLPHEVPRTA